MTRAAVFVALAACASAPTPVPDDPRAAHWLATLADLEHAHDLAGGVVGHAERVTVVISFASWCRPCHDELAELATVRASHPDVRIVGINYMPYETYGARGGPAELRAFLAADVPWLRVVPVDDALFDALDHPSKIPTLWVFDARGRLAALFPPRVGSNVSAPELSALLDRVERR